MILVTGGTGLVGSHLLLQLLRSGEKVRAIYRTMESLEAIKQVFRISIPQQEGSALFEQIDWVEADILDVPALSSAFRGVKRVFHCAALVSFDPGKDSELRKINIEGTANVVNCCIDYEIERLVYVSSIATLDKRPGDTLISESSQWNKENDHSMYAITKYGAEMEVWRGSQEGVPVVIVNPGIIIGPGFWHTGSGQLFKRIQEGLKYYPPKVTGFIGVKDVASVLCHLMGSPVKNEQFILVAENLSFQSVLDEIARILHRPTPKNKLTPSLLWVGWLLEKISSGILGKERKLSRHAVRSMFVNNYYTSEKIIQETGKHFQPMNSVLAETGKIFLDTISSQASPPAK